MDDLTASGFIGLQVHSIGNSPDAAKIIKWRNIRICTEDVKKYQTPTDPDVPEMSYLINQLSTQEKRKGWRLLWDGKTLENWNNYQDKWLIKNDAISIEKDTAAILISKEEYADFELEMEFKISKGANGGIFYYGASTRNLTYGLEYQIVDDKVEAAYSNPNQTNTLAALNGLIAPENLSIEGRGKQFKGIGNWNKLRIVARNGVIQHWLNDEQMIEYDRNSQAFKALSKHGEFYFLEDYATRPTGRIILQGSDKEIQFRSIKLREF